MTASPESKIMLLDGSGYGFLNRAIYKATADVDPPQQVLGYVGGMAGSTIMVAELLDEPFTFARHGRRSRCALHHSNVAR